jgi:hypothetical protein
VGWGGSIGVLGGATSGAVVIDGGKAGSDSDADVGGTSGSAEGGGDWAGGSDGLGDGGLVADDGALVAEGGKGSVVADVDGLVVGGSVFGTSVAGRSVAEGNSEDPAGTLGVIFSVRSCSPSQPSAKNSSPSGNASLTT